MRIERNLPESKHLKDAKLMWRKVRLSGAFCKKAKRRSSTCSRAIFQDSEICPKNPVWLNRTLMLEYKKQTRKAGSKSGV